MMDLRRWNRIPGEEDLLLYPIIRRIDILSSNSFIIRSEEWSLLIDPGGILDQAEEIISIIQDCEQQPLIGILLTHCHMDHCYSLIEHPALSQYAQCSYAHTIGIDALRDEDDSLTQATLLGRRMSPVLIGNPLFSSGGEIGDYGLAEETLLLPGGYEIHAYHTPGHSPDTISYQVGRILFFGDTLFAAAPAVAGIIGYSREDLLTSLSGLMRLIAGEEILICFSSHGNPVSGPDALRSIQALLDEVEKLDDIAQVTPLWAEQTAQFADDLMAEIDETLTVISGRIAFVSHMLEELEESAGAEGISSKIDAAAVDDLLNRYNQFAQEFRRGAHQNIKLAHFAASIAGKLEGLIDRGGLGPVIEHYLLDHLEELINDYMTTYRGFRPLAAVTTADPSAILEGIIRSYDQRRAPPLDPDSEEAFLAGLIQQIARVQVIREGSIRLSIEGDPGDLIMDPARFRLASETLLLKYAATGADEIAITIHRIDAETTSITFRCEPPVDIQGVRYFRKAFSLSGGTMHEAPGRITIAYPAS